MRYGPSVSEWKVHMSYIHDYDMPSGEPFSTSTNIGCQPSAVTISNIMDLEVIAHPLRAYTLDTYVGRVSAE